jgi:hypothetical protein
MDVVAFIRDLGFPVFVSLYLLFRLDRQMSSLVEEIRKWNGKNSSGS